MARVRGRQVPDVIFGALIDGVGWVDSAWVEGGLPTCWWNRARPVWLPAVSSGSWVWHPVGTRRSRALRRRPGGYLHAWLYRMDLAGFKRQATPPVLAALAAAMQARRTCRSCGLDTGCCIPRSLGQCWDCHLNAPARAAANLARDPGVTS